MKEKVLDVVVVSYQTPELVEIVVKSFQKFSKDLFKINFIIVENSDYNLTEFINKKCLKNITVINNPINQTLSEAHGSGLEASKKFVSAEYVFTCHSDTCVTNKTFFEELKFCIEEGISLAGVCEDKHPDRVKALHCSGLLVDSKIFKSVSLTPKLPKIDTADFLTIYCKENNLKTKLFRNTYNDENLVNLCNSPFKELGENCGVDRCLDRNNNVMFIHQGRGTTKNQNKYHQSGKMMTKEWIQLTNSILEL